MTPEMMEEALNQPEIWLTPSSVKGYDAADFVFLPPEQVAELTTNVEGFLAIAKAVRLSKSSTPDQVNAARPLFEKIVKLLEFDRFADAEAFRIGKRIESDPLFPREDVVDVRYRTGYDWQGEPALKMMVYIRNADEGFLSSGMEVKDKIFELARELDAPYFPFISVRSEGDLANLPKVGADA